MSKHVVLPYSILTRTTSVISDEFPGLRHAGPPSFLGVVFGLVRGLYALNPEQGEAHLRALDALCLLGYGRMKERALGNEVLKYLELHGIATRAKRTRKPRPQ